MPQVPLVIGESIFQHDNARLQKIGSTTGIYNEYNLRSEIHITWGTFPQEDINHLVRSMPNRVEELINL